VYGYPGKKDNEDLFDHPEAEGLSKLFGSLTIYHLEKINFLIRAVVVIIVIIDYKYTPGQNTQRFV